MRNFRLTLRNLFHKGQNTIAKILTLSLGLTFGLVLIATHSNQFEALKSE